MPILLRRVDERLIHGQVVVGWGRALSPDHFLVVDDVLADSDWEQELYLLAVDDGTEVTFESVSEAREHWSDWERDDDRIVLLVRDVDTMRRLAEGGRMSGAEVNLGGIHDAPGRTAVRPYLHLDQRDRDALRSLAAEGVHLTGRDLPDAAPVPLDELLTG